MESFTKFNFDEKQQSIFDLVYSSGYNALFESPDKDNKISDIILLASTLRDEMIDIINDSMADEAWVIEDLETIVVELDSLLSVLSSYSSHLDKLVDNFFPIIGVSTIDVRVEVTNDESIDGREDLIQKIKSYNIDNWLTEKLDNILENLEIIQLEFNTGPGSFTFEYELTMITSDRVAIASQQSSEESYLGLLLNLQDSSTLGTAIESSRILSYTYTIDSLNKSTDRRDFLLAIASNQLLEIL